MGYELEDFEKPLRAFQEAMRTTINNEMTNLAEKILLVNVGNDGNQFPHTTDARIWAKVWNLIIKEYPGIPTDEEAMIGWFANAIMAGYNAGAVDAGRVD